MFGNGPPGMDMPLGGYNMGPNFDVNRPYDQTWQSVPVPGVTSGMLASGMNFDYLPPQTPIMAPQPPPSPLQQYVALGGNKPGGPFAIGSPVKVVHMTSPESQPYNGLIGDIFFVNTIDKEDGTTDLLFDIRCPLDNRIQWYPAMCKDKEHCDVKPTMEAMRAAPLNVKILGPDTPLYKDNGGGAPPYLVLKKLPTEKLEPISHGGGGHGMRRPGPPGAEMLPMMTRPPIIGPPAVPPPPGSRPLGPPDPYGDVMMGPTGGYGMPPSQPWGQAAHGAASMNMGPPMGPSMNMGPMGQSMNMGPQSMYMR